MKMHSDRNNIQLELIRLRKKYRLYCTFQYFMLDNNYEIRHLAIREVSPPFGRMRAVEGFLKKFVYYFTIFV